MKKLTVRDLMTPHLITLQRDETINLAGELMKMARIRHLPVVEHNKLVGLVTHRDLLAAQISLLADTSTAESSPAIDGNVPVASIMVSDVATVGPEEPALDAARRLREHKYGCLPVVSNEKLVGIITEADFLTLAIRALEQREAAEA